MIMIVILGNFWPIFFHDFWQNWEQIIQKKIMFLKILIEFIEIFYICFVNIKKLVRQNRLTLKYFILKSIIFIKNILNFCVLVFMRYFYFQWMNDQKTIIFNTIKITYKNGWKNDQIKLNFGCQNFIAKNWSDRLEWF